MLLTVDIGTTNFKSALWDYDGNRTCMALVKLSNKILETTKHETDPSGWLGAFEQCCKQFGERSKNLKNVEAIVISGNGPTLVPVLGAPKIVNSSLFVDNFPARLWLDRRAEKYQELVSDVMNGYVDACFFLPKIIDIKNNESELYRKTKYFIGCPEYLAYALTGEACSVFPSDGFDRWFWNNSALEKLDLDAEKFPPFIRPGERFGFLGSEAAEHFGFTKNIPVVSGGPDFFAAILGSGVTKPGEVCNRTGSSDGINLCSEKPAQDSTLMSYGHPVKPFWNVSGVINTSGKAIEWGRKLLEIDCFDDFIELAKGAKKGSGGLVFNPYLAGKRSKNSGSAAGASWSGITLESGRQDFANSILEGIALEIKDILCMMKDSGAKADVIRVTGGLADCSFFNQIKADITGLEVLEGNYKEAELLGLAIIGSCFMGKYASWEEASLALCKTKKRYKPGADAFYQFNC